MSNVVGDTKPRENVEDTAVDVHDLPEYIAEFDEILRTKYDIECVYYAHAGSGELHTRPLFNLKTPKGMGVNLRNIIALIKEVFTGSFIIATVT
jgi:FAD/FMN-containing dehydrogenase